MKRPAVALLGAVITASMLGACTLFASEPTPSATAPPPAGSFPADLSAYYQQSVPWRDCGANWLCVDVSVPRDYDDPAAGDFAISVMRLPASGEERLGALVVNPGGPGGSGLDYARSARIIVSPSVLAAYDIVGFDPRGVGESEAVECLSDAETDDLVAADPTPDDQSELDLLIAETGGVGQACANRSPQVYRWLDTRSAAKDMDILRQALGESKLNLLGKSYGTQLGAVYAEQFPERVGRFVLDGALPVDLTSKEVSHGQAIAFEGALRRFVANCLPMSDCPLRAASVDDGVAEIRAFLSGLEAAPIPARGPRDLTEALAVNAVLYYLYFPPSDWAKLRQGIAAAYDGDGSVLLEMLDARLERNPTTGRYATNAMDAFFAIGCLDKPAVPLDEVAVTAQQLAVDAPTFGPYLAWSDATCAQWPVAPVAEPRVVTAAGSGPILVVSTQYDPATPYDWGVRMADTFANAGLVSWNGDGHTAYRMGSECVDAAVDEYLLTGALPAADPRCGY